MYIAFLLCGLLSAAAIAQRQPKNVQFQPGLMYIYEYTSRLLTGIPEIDDQYSGSELTANLIIQPRSPGLVAFKLNNVKVGRLNDPVSSNYEEDIDMVHRFNKEYQRELSKPIRFIHRNGRVLAFEADKSEPEWSLNIKKGILSLFNINLTPQKVMQAPSGNFVPKPISLQDLTYYGLYERGIGGICETVYEVTQVPDPDDQFGEKAFVFNVTKTRNYDNCLTQPSIVNENLDIRGCLKYCRQGKSFSPVPGYYPVPDSVSDPLMTGCPCGHTPTDSPVDQYNYVVYNISNVGSEPMIEEVFSVGKVVYNYMDSKILVVTHQNASLVQKISSRQQAIPSIPNPQRHEELAFRIPISQYLGSKYIYDIPYLHLYGQNIDEWAENVPKVFEKIADDIIAGDVSSTKTTAVKLGEVIQQLAALPISKLESLYKQIAQEGNTKNANAKDQVLRQLFLQTLPLSGTNVAANLIARLVEANLVSTYEAKNLVEAVPKHIYLPDVQTINAYFELCQNSNATAQQHLFASTCIAFAKLVAEGCVSVHQNPGDIPNDKNVPHDLRHPAAQQVIARTDPRQTVINIAHTQRAKRSAPWESIFPQQMCQESDIIRYVVGVAKLFQEAQTYQEKLVYLQTLTLMEVPQVFPILEPYVNGHISENACPGYPVRDTSEVSEECIFVRTAVFSALNSLTTLYPKQILSLCLPVYRDLSEPYQLRLVAFYNVLASAPDSHILESIASQLHAETNRQVRSYVASAIENYSNLTIPCAKKLADITDDVADFLPDVNDGIQYSQEYAADAYDEDDDFGILAYFGHIANNQSTYLSRLVNVDVQVQNNVFLTNLFTLSVHQKGLDKYVNRVLEPNGLLSDMFEGLTGKQQQHRNSRSKRNTNSAQQALEELKERLNFQTRTEDAPKVEIFSQLFGETSYYVLDEKAIKSLINEMEEEMGNVAQSLVDGYNGHFVRVFMPFSYQKLVPSELGLPVLVSHQLPIIFSVKIDRAKLDLNFQPKGVYPIGVNVSASITPQLIASNIICVSAISSGRRLEFGTFVENSLRSALPLEMNIGYYRPKNIVTASIMPNLPKSAVTLTTQPKTYVSRANIASAPEVDGLHDSKLIKSVAVPFRYESRIGHDLLGIGIHYEANTEDPFNDYDLFDVDEDLYGLDNVLKFFLSSDLKAREIHINIEPDQNQPTYGADLTLQYKWIAEEEHSSDDDDSDESGNKNESDSDESNSEESKSDSEKSNSSQTSEESSESTNDSKSQSDSGDSSSSESQENKQNLNKLVHKLRVHKVRKSQQNADSSSASDSDSKDSSEESPNSPETSEENDSDSKSSSESNSKSDSKSIKENKSKSSSQSSSSADSSSSESSESVSSSEEESIFDYEDVISLILGQDVPERDIKKISQHLIQKTRDSWIWAYDEDADESSSDASSQNEDNIVPATITHDFALTAVARGPQPSYLAANLIYMHTVDNRVNWVKFDAHVKTPVGVYANKPNLFCADAVISYPPLPGDLSYDPTTMQELKAKIKTEIGWGPKCRADGGVIITGILEKTADQVWQSEDFNSQDGANQHHIQDWFYHQCEVDKSNGQTLSFACEQAILKDSYFNRLVLDIAYKNIPKEIQNISQKLDLALKVALYDQMDYNAIDVDNPDDQIRIIADYSEKVPEYPMVNLHIAKPEEETNFEKVYVPYFRPPSAVHNYVQVLGNLITGFESIAPSCAIMEESVRTFDNVTYVLPETNCQYLVAMDCSPHERFAVFATTLDSHANTKKVTLFTNGQHIKLVPPQEQNVAQIVVDGKTMELKSNNPQYFCNGHSCVQIYLQVTPSDTVPPIVVVNDPYVDLKVKYDGKNLKVEIGTQYKGKTCGFCGNNDDESDEEFEGPGQCIYYNAEDFVHSYTLTGEHCSQVAAPQGKVRCPKGVRQQPGAVKRTTTVQTRHEPSGSTTVVRKQTNVQITPANEVPACQTMRNRFVVRNQVVCFTTLPLATCSESCIPTIFQSITVDFHCLEGSSPFTKQLMLEAQTQVLTQLANKRVDFRESINVPTTCAPAH
ncbi:vitellogenin-like protein [Dinothrombium tinctorium]|uniref:Vitellogenin-like protein n=1 Tax=Dinothrombium tinctorium TaxID=1965070 RepID=A0A3S3P660_9ACAR|nr:vitellogenin-like protein [Dinothrombium tinctorium]RWS06226.1 vitellogenin-like protein [Dinothrombium tinctorium]